MCFHLNKISSKKSLKAKKDIICYKILSWNNKSPNYKYKYLIGVTQPKIKLIVLNGHDELNYINNGYHSYSSYLQGIKHLWCYSESYLSYKHFSLRKFIIPKGTKYYFSEDDSEYVSETIKMVDILLKDRLFKLMDKLNNLINGNNNRNI